MITLNFVKSFSIELARVALLAALPLLITSLEAGSVDWNAIGIVTAVAVLRAIDRALHESGVSEKGITRF